MIDNNLFKNGLWKTLFYSGAFLRVYLRGKLNMENTSLFDKNKAKCFSGIELLRLLSKFSGVQWGIQHMPKEMKLYTSNGTYIFKADSAEMIFEEA